VASDARRRPTRARAVLELPDAPACVVDAAVGVLHALLLLLDRMLDLAAHVSEGIQPKRRRGIHLLDHFWVVACGRVALGFSAPKKETKWSYAGLPYVATSRDISQYPGMYRNISLYPVISRDILTYLAICHNIIED